MFNKTIKVKYMSRHGYNGDIIEVDEITNDDTVYQVQHKICKKIWETSEYEALRPMLPNFDLAAVNYTTNDQRSLYSSSNFNEEIESFGSNDIILIPNTWFSNSTRYVCQATNVVFSFIIKGKMENFLKSITNSEYKIYKKKKKEYGGQLVPIEEIKGDFNKGDTYILIDGKIKTESLTIKMKYQDEMGCDGQGVIYTENLKFIGPVSDELDVEQIFENFAHPHNIEQKNEAPNIEQKSSVEQKNEAPNVEQKSSVEQKNEAPNVEQKSSVEQKNEAPNIEQKSSVEQKNEAPNIEQKLSVEQKNEALNVEQKSSKSFLEQKTKAPNIEQKSSVAQKNEALNVEQKSSKSFLEQKTKAPNIEQKSFAQQSIIIIGALCGAGTLLISNSLVPMLGKSNISLYPTRLSTVATQALLGAVIGGIIATGAYYIYNYLNYSKNENVMER